MKLIKAFNYMKKIINNGKENDLSVDNVRKGVIEYIDTLVQEKEISFDDRKILIQVSKKLKKIMESKVTADEVFVEAISIKDNIDYIGCSIKKVEKIRKCFNEEPKKQIKQSKVQSDISTDTGNPWDYLPVEPGTCGRTWDAQRRAQWEAMHKSEEIDYSRCGRFR